MICNRILPSDAGQPVTTRANHQRSTHGFQDLGRQERMFPEAQKGASPTDALQTSRRVQCTHCFQPLSLLATAAARTWRQGGGHRKHKQSWTGKRTCQLGPEGMEPQASCGRKSEVRFCSPGHPCWGDCRRSSVPPGDAGRRRRWKVSAPGLAPCCVLSTQHSINSQGQGQADRMRTLPAVTQCHRWAQLCARSTRPWHME